MYLCSGRKVVGSAEVRPMSDRPRDRVVFLFVKREDNVLGFQFVSSRFRISNVKGLRFLNVMVNRTFVLIYRNTLKNWYL